MSASCQQQANTLAIVVSLALVIISTVSILAFYGWRRAALPWRTISFTIFTLCSLLLLDAFLLAVAISVTAPPVTAAHSC